MNRVSAALIVDACLVITFGSVGRLGLLTGLRGHEVLIGPRSLAEVAKQPTAGAIREAIAAGTVTMATLDPGAATDQAALAGLPTCLSFETAGR